MKGIVCLLIVAIVAITRNHGLDYTDLENLGATCPLRDSCQEMPGGANFTHRSCECDRLCSVFRDCCIDADAPPTPRRYRSTRLLCMEYGNDPDVGVYVVDRCPRNYAGPTTLRNKCEDDDDFSDPLVSTPVTEISMGVTFKNRYCAECNNASPDVLESWLMFLNCETLSTYDLEDSFIWNNLVYRPGDSSWGVNFQRQFHACELVFDKPANLRSGVRLCRTNLTSTCPPTWRRLSVKRACESYMAVMHGSNDVSYKNVHCAICHGQPVNTLYCNQGWISNRGRKPFSFAMLLDVNRSDGDIVGEVAKCPSGQKYDPFFKKCRTLVCALPGFKMVNGKCKKT